MPQLEVPQYVIDRLMSRIVTHANGCQTTSYSVGSHGYAQIGWHGGKTMTLAHRVVWVAVNGPIPEDMTIDHLCRNKRCVNVSHLRLLSHFENVRRHHADWPLGECANGHSNSELVTGADGRQRCPECYRQYRARYRVKTKES